jgi:hypothetical protein
MEDIEYSSSDSVEELIKKIESARIAAFENTLPSGVTYESVKNDLMKRYQANIDWLSFCFDYILNNQVSLDEKINKIKTDYEVNILEDLLSKEVLIMRCAFLYTWFIKSEPAKDDKDISINLKLYHRALQRILKIHNRAQDMTWITEEVDKYIGVGEFDFEQFTSYVGEKMATIAFEATEGRLAGDIYDAVVELIQSTVMEDKSVFLE